jgi:hypothetical protein
MERAVDDIITVRIYHTTDISDIALVSKGLSGQPTRGISVRCPAYTRWVDTSAPVLTVQPSLPPSAQQRSEITGSSEWYSSEHKCLRA